MQLIRGLLENLVVAQLVTEILHFLFHAKFYYDVYKTFSEPYSQESNISLKMILIFCHLYIAHPSDVSISFSGEVFYAFLIPHMFVEDKALCSVLLHYSVY